MFTSLIPSYKYVLKKTPLQVFSGIYPKINVDGKVKSLDGVNIILRILNVGSGVVKKFRVIEYKVVVKGGLATKLLPMKTRSYRKLKEDVYVEDQYYRTIVSGPK